jgi:hypothetical protein
LFFRLRLRGLYVGIPMGLLLREGQRLQSLEV